MGDSHQPRDCALRVKFARWVGSVCRGLKCKWEIGDQLAHFVLQKHPLVIQNEESRK